MRNIKTMKPNVTSAVELFVKKILKSYTIGGLTFTFSRADTPGITREGNVIDIHFPQEDVVGHIATFTSGGQFKTMVRVRERERNPKGLVFIEQRPFKHNPIISVFAGFDDGKVFATMISPFLGFVCAAFGPKTFLEFLSNPPEKLPHAIRIRHALRQGDIGFLPLESLKNTDMLGQGYHIEEAGNKGSFQLFKTDHEATLVGKRSQSFQIVDRNGRPLENALVLPPTIVSAQDHGVVVTPSHGIFFRINTQRSFPKLPRTD